MARTLIAALGAVALLSASASAEPAFKPVNAKDGYFKTSDGVRLHYLELGKGRPIVFVPGWTVPAWTWDPQIRYFSKDYRVIALDPRSQGKSDQANDGFTSERRAKDIKELVDRLKLEQAVLVGHSLAVSELLSYAEQFGAGDIAGLVLVDQDFGPYPTEGAEKFLGFLRLVGDDRRQLLDQFRGWFFKKPTPPGYWEKLAGDAMKTPTNTALALLIGRVGRDYRPTLAKLDVPVLFAFQPQFKDAGEWLKKTQPNAKVEMFEDSGHVIFMDDAERFNSVLEKFARGAFERRHSPG